MKILVVGGGAREHAFAWKLSRERQVRGVLCAPGNPGVAAVARCIAADAGKPHDLLAIAVREQVDLTVVGPEVPLSRGIVDLFDTNGLSIVGPSACAAQLEASKAFAKEFMARHDVPTARSRVCDSADAALREIARGEFGYPLVVKADGLAAGKGVIIADDRAAAEAVIRDIMIDGKFGASGARVVLEEFLSGDEASYFVLADGAAFMPLASAQDHKRIFDDDCGPNTGGMGAFAPSPLITPDVERRVIDTIVRPVLDGMRREGHPYRGFLYVGLMLTREGPKVIEFNVRFGDPEAQVVLPMLDEDLSALLSAAASGELPSRAARFSSQVHVGVVLASGGYPDAVETGHVISGIEAAAEVPNAVVFHAGTARQNGHLVTSGGRVLTVVGRGGTYRDAIDTAYAAASKVCFDGMQFRHDIGRKAMA
ncbi:MAG TPA: phosphoribosylamine--glycine ligase [Vicinamibacterales bacterium]|jgi:phosphoribosylamine--glycine ligase|nr:phosphoribosylamine--glycine ligase [Vicinamibacterales bacterium]